MSRVGADSRAGQTSERDSAVRNNTVEKESLPDEAVRPDHLFIVGAVPTRARVLDLGCGEGVLLKMLEEPPAKTTMAAVMTFFRVMKEVPIVDVLAHTVWAAGRRC